MKITTPAVLFLCLAAVAGCTQTQTVRGPGGESLESTTPTNLAVHRGASVALKVGIDRQQFSGPVTVSISQLPKGVHADRPTATVETTSATFVLEASRSADLVTNQQVAVTVAGMGGRKSTQYVSLDVLD